MVNWYSPLRIILLDLFTKSTKGNLFNSSNQSGWKRIVVYSQGQKDES
jgi:hypothetical protein